MPLTLVNPDMDYSLLASYSGSSSSHDTTQLETQSQPNSRFSLHSFISSSEHTAVSDSTKVSSHERPFSKFDDNSSIYKSLPPLPLSDSVKYTHQSKRSDDYDVAAHRHHSSTTSEPFTLPNTHALTTIAQLASALGPDNVPYTTEIASIPCAGVRVPHGPLTGLLAWRLVVSNPLPIKSPRRGWWGTGDHKNGRSHHREATGAPLKTHSNSWSELTHPQSTQLKPWAATSTNSLPMQRTAMNHSPTLSENYTIPGRPQSAVMVVEPASYVVGGDGSLQAPAAVNTRARLPAVATNFILDTGLPYSIISRDTLAALGYSPDRLPPPHANPHALDYDNTDELRNSQLMVSLSIQGVTTRVRIARSGEASRLGVQYLRDASVSVFFPRDGDGVGPVLYYEHARLLRDVPCTITSVPGHGRTGKPTLPQRVRALFGLL